MGATSQKLKLKREFSAGGVVWKKENGKDYFLITRPKGTDRWQLPKGNIEEGESSESAALREVEEEGGVKVKIIGKIGIQKLFFYWNKERIFKTVTYFLMEYLFDSKDGHDHEVDEVAFLPFDEAHKKLTFKNDKEILTKAKEILEQPKQENLI